MMKVWHLLLGIIVCLIIAASPAVAISKSELISQYKTGYFPGPTPPTPIPTTIPTTGPTNIPTGTQTEPFVINPGAGTLFITSGPYGGANVYLDGEWKGRTPFIFALDETIPRALILTDLPLGPHQLTFTQEGYEDYSISVTLKRGVFEYVFAPLVQISPEPFPIPTTIPTTGPTNIPTGTQTDPYVINPATGTLFITSAPYGGANVYLDGEWKGRTPSTFAPKPRALVLTDLPPGPHQLTFTQEWFKDYSISVTLERGEIEYVTAHLVQISPEPTPTPTVIPTTVPTPAPSNRPYPIVPDPSTKTKRSYLDSLSELFL